MSKHTQTPWGCSYNGGQWTINSIPKETIVAIGTFWDEKYYQEESKSNAHFIVKAVNCHDELLTALKLAVHAINRKPNYPVNCENKNIKNSYAIAAICDMAIAKAESEE